MCIETTSATNAVKPASPFAPPVATYGWHDTVVIGDNVDVLRTLPDACLDLTVTSPPYDDLRHYAGEWTLDLAATGEELFRCTKDGGVVAMVIGDATKNFAKSLTTFRTAVDWCDRIGWRLFETCIYSRDGNPGGWWASRFRVDHEYILIFFKGARPKTFHKDALMIHSRFAGKVTTVTDRNTDGTLRPTHSMVVPDMKCRGTIWPYVTSNRERDRKSNALKLKHPATFPEMLADDLIRCFFDEGDLVADPFVGSGTTLVRASRLARHYIGMDVNPAYVELSRERLRTEAPFTEFLS